MPTRTTPEPEREELFIVTVTGEDNQTATIQGTDLVLLVGEDKAGSGGKIQSMNTYVVASENEAIGLLVHLCDWMARHGAPDFSKKLISTLVQEDLSLRDKDTFHAAG